MDNNLPIYNSSQNTIPSQSSDDDINASGTNVPTEPTPTQQPSTPTNPEGIGTIESTHVIEQTPITEAQIAPETQRTPEVPANTLQTQKQEPEEEELPAQFQITEPVPNVVDKTEQITQLRAVDNTSDELTKEADEKEKKFIEEVEKHHGDL